MEDVHLTVPMDHQLEPCKKQQELPHSQVLLIFKPKLWPTDQSKLCSLSMKTSSHKHQESKFKLQTNSLDNMQLKLSDGEHKELNNNGSSKTHGVPHGDFPDNSGSKWDNAVLTPALLQVWPSSDN